MASSGSNLCVGRCRHLARLSVITFFDLGIRFRPPLGVGLRVGRRLLGDDGIGGGFAWSFEWFSRSVGHGSVLAVVCVRIRLLRTLRNVGGLIRGRVAGGRDLWVLVRFFWC